MSDFSKSPSDLLSENQQKGYVGIHIEQGVPVLDRDLNLLHDLIADAVRSVVRRYIGDGIAAGKENENGVGIQAIPADNNFLIRAGHCLVGGIELAIPTDLKYSSQVDMPPLTTPPVGPPEPRVDSVYLDTWVVEVDGTTKVDGSTDTTLLNSTDVGMQTSTRQKLVWRVRVAENVSSLPPPEPDHTHFPLAQLRRPRGNALIDQTMITDLRQTKLTLSDAEKRLQVLEKLVLRPTFASTPFDPVRGAPGAEVKLLGKNFDVAGKPTVLFGTVPVPASDVGTPSPTDVFVKVPQMSAGQVFVTIETSLGPDIKFSDVSDIKFNVLPILVPLPHFGSPPFDPVRGAPGREVLLQGEHFDVDVGAGRKPTVLFGAVTVLDSDVGTPTADGVNVKVPQMSAGQVFVTIQTSAGSDVSGVKFNVLPPLPP